MSNEPTAEAATLSARPRRRLLRPTVLLLLGLLAVLIAFPPTYCAIAGGLLKIWAWQQGASVEVERLDGSIFEPFQLEGVVVESRLATGALLKARFEKVSVALAPKHFVVERDLPILDQLVIEGAHAVLRLPEPEEVESERGEKRGYRPDFPRQLEIRDSTVEIFAGSAAVTAGGVSLSVNRFEKGDLSASRLDIHTPDFSKSFEQISGSTSMQGRDLQLLGVALSPDLVLDSATVDLKEWSGGRGNVSLTMSAFGGRIRGEMRSRLDRPNSRLEASGTFAQLSIAGLADFLDADVEAGGTINEGKFTFRGFLRRPEKATASVRVDASKFQWGGREWNSLVLGATLVDRQLTVTELNLRQAENALIVDGRLSLPESWDSWWKNEFSFNISGQINNLESLTALLGPGVPQASGRLRVEGSVRANHEKFAGQLIVSGSRLKYGGAPIERLQAAIQLGGNELQLQQFELIQKNDFVRGRGLVTILGPKRYWGEISASIEDLKVYEGLLQPPIAPGPVEGGLSFKWSGDGAAHAHSGAFEATFRKLRPLAGEKPRPPLDGVMEATYSPDNIYFTKFNLSQKTLALSATVNATPSTLKLTNIRLTRAGSEILTAEASLPVNVWEWWQQASPMSDLFGKGKDLHLSADAKALPLADILEWSGSERRVRGELTGTVSASRVSGEIDLAGSCVFENGSLQDLVPGFSPENIRVEAFLDGQVLRADRFSANALGGTITGSGEINLSHPEDPNLRLDVMMKKTTLALGENDSARFDADLKINGPADAAYVDGTAVVSRLALATTPDFGALFTSKDRPPLRIAIPKSDALANWRWNIAVKSEKPLEVNKGLRMEPDLVIRGRTSDPGVRGQFAVSGTLRNGNGLEKFEGVIQMGAPNRIALQATGPGGLAAWAVGPWESPRVARLDSSFPEATFPPATPSPAPLRLDQPLELNLARSGPNVPTNPLGNNASSRQ